MKIKTKLKLDLIDPKTGECLINKKNKHDEEIHFVTFEGRHPALELTMESMRSMTAEKIGDIEDWTIVDFDNCL